VAVKIHFSVGNATASAHPAREIPLQYQEILRKYRQIMSKLEPRPAVTSPLSGIEHQPQTSGAFRPS
jgi:hypothetical protein